MFKALRALLAAGLAACLAMAGCVPPATPRTTLRIAMPYSEHIQNIGANYYKNWLEEQTGMTLEITFIPRDFTLEYLRLLLSAQGSEIDGVFFQPDSGQEELIAAVNQYGKSGLVLPLNHYIDQCGVYTPQALAGFTQYDLRKAICAEDGQMYYLPWVNTSEITQNSQGLWLNVGWLKVLGRRIPQTTQEFYETLLAFQTQDPNQNGLADEIPLIAGDGNYTKQTHNFIINAFVYNDPQNSRMAVQQGRVFFAPATEAWREAMVYLNGLYDQGLILPTQAGLDEFALNQLVNDPRDLVGGFCARSITDVIHPDSPEIIENFIHVPPLTGPGGYRAATLNAPTAQVGGIILQKSRNPQAMFQLMDLMLSPQASLISRYGQQGVDWDFGAQGDIDILGNAAALHVKNQLQHRVQNQTLLGAGPFLLEAKYMDSITWSGFQADKEFMDACAALTYRPYMPQEFIKIIHFETPDAPELAMLRRQLDAYTEESLRQFVLGQRDPSSPQDWAQYLAELEVRQLPRLLEAVQQSYESM